VIKGKFVAYLIRVFGWNNYGHLATRLVVTFQSHSNTPLAGTKRIIFLVTEVMCVNNQYDNHCTNMSVMLILKFGRFVDRAI